MHRFQLVDQRAFADFSGDENPLHVDPLAARRTPFGRPIVHGIHLVLWALDSVLTAPARLRRIKVSFPSAVGVGEPAGLRVLQTDPMKIAVESYGITKTLIECVFDAGEHPGKDPPAPLQKSQSRERGANDMVGARGELELVIDAARSRAMFSKLAPDQVALLIATTRLVGMECPGLNSIFSELELEFGDAERLVWSVVDFDTRFNRAAIDLRGEGVRGRLVAFLRPAPAVQPSMADIRKRVPSEAFRAQRAMVIGGSRGLGEVCAKMLAAGGADVLLTYHRGRADAERVLADIRSGGGAAETIAFDVLDPAPLRFAASHLYYFATPAIFISAHKQFSNEIFKNFCDFYVGGLVKTVHAVRAAQKANQADSPVAPLAVLYPSSVAVDEPPPNMGEYAAAKAAGEAACRFLQAADRKLCVTIERLPRVPTDQTANVQSVAASDPVEVLGKILLAMCP